MIAINAKFAIKSDSRQWILCKAIKPSKTQPDGWSPFQFYVSLQALMDALRDIMLRTSEYESFADLSKNLAEINKLLDRKLKVAL